MATIVITVADSDSYVAKRPAVAEALRTGRLVIFPTETVYGVAASAADSQAIERLRAAKGRGDSQPFTVHLGRREDARLYLTSPSALVRRLVRKGWPGPLTLICEEPSPATTGVARQYPAAPLDEIFAGGAVGLRCPDQADAAWLLSTAGVPVVASSANRAGRPPPLEVHSALGELGDAADYAIDAGRTRLNSASTIVAVHENKWEIRRTGALDERIVQRMARSEILFVCTGNSCRSPLAEYLFRQRLAARLELTEAALAEHGYFVASAGTYATHGYPASSGTLAELAARGIPAEGHRSQPVTVELVQRAERIFVMSAEHRDEVLRLVPAAAARVTLLDEDGHVPDPMGGSPEDYRRAAAQIERAVERRVEEFVHEDRAW